MLRRKRLAVEPELVEPKVIDLHLAQTDENSEERRKDREFREDIVARLEKIEAKLAAPYLVDDRRFRSSQTVTEPDDVRTYPRALITQEECNRQLLKARAELAQAKFQANEPDTDCLKAAIRSGIRTPQEVIQEMVAAGEIVCGLAARRDCADRVQEPMKNIRGIAQKGDAACNALTLSQRVEKIEWTLHQIAAERFKAHAEARLPTETDAVSPRADAFEEVQRRKAAEDAQKSDAACNDLSLRQRVEQIEQTLAQKAAEQIQADHVKAHIPTNVPEFKFGTDELNTIAGHNTPEKIAGRVLHYRSEIDEANRCIREIDFARGWYPIIDGASRRSVDSCLCAIHVLTEKIAADEDRLEALLAGAHSVRVQ